MALAFLTWSLTARTITLYSSHATCPCFHHLPPCFLFVFEFAQELLVHPCRPLVLFAWLLLCWDASLLSLEEMIHGDEPVFLGPSSLQGFISWYSIRYTTSRVYLQIKESDTNSQLNAECMRSSNMVLEMSPHLTHKAVLPQT